MFRPFLPCGIAYGFAYGSAYALPMALPMAIHALFPAEGIPPGCLYCTISARCLSTGFGRISAAFAFFRRRGGAPVSGGIAPALQARRALAAPYGGVLSLLPAYSAFSLLYRPLSPQPALAERSSPAGKGETQSLFRRGLRPRHPCTEPLAALTDPAIQAPCEREPAARCKNGGNAFLWTMPAAKERGDRGRWNYPSQATAAFEMVLSPGAGIASAAWGQAPQPPAGYHSGKVSRRPAGQVPRQRVIRAPAPVPPGFSPGDARGEAPCIRKPKISPFPGGEGGRGDRGQNQS